LGGEAALCRIDLLKDFKYLPIVKIEGQLRQPKVTANLRTEERILVNALHHFCNYGYNGTSVREITSASEVTKPTLYYYFKNKEELFTKLAQTCFEMVIVHMNELISKEITFEGALKALFTSMNDVFTKNPSALKFIHSVIVAPQRGSPDVGAKGFVDNLDITVSRIMKKAIDNKECVAQKEQAVQMMISALLGLHTKSVITSPNLDSSDSQKWNAVISTLVGCARNPGCPEV
jgi:AcrR family transcriptional regulator